MTDKAKRSKILQCFLDISLMHKEVLPSHKQKNHPYEYHNPFGLKKDKPLKRNFQNQLSHPNLSHTEQECQDSLIRGKIQIQ